MAKKISFSGRYSDVAQEALDFIKKSLKKSDRIVLATDEELDTEDNLLYELPIVSQVTKHGYYDEYGVISVEKKSATEIILHTRGKGESSDDMDFDISELDNGNLCFLADEIADKLKK